MKASIFKDNNFNDGYWIIVNYGDHGDSQQSVLCNYKMLLDIRDEIDLIEKQKNDLEGFHE